MTDLVHETVLPESSPSGEYPVALKDAKSVLVQERENFMPIYMPAPAINNLEARVKRARALGMIKEGGVKDIVERAIGEFRGGASQMISGMIEWGQERFVYGVLLSNDIYSSDSAVGIPDDPSYSFEFKPKTFRLGLTGRYLLDDRRQVHEEALLLPATIYDAYNMAVSLSPARVVAVDSAGNEEVVYDNNRAVGRTEKFEGNPRRLLYVLGAEAGEHKNPELLPTDGMRIMDTGFWLSIRNRDTHSALFSNTHSALFGHKYDGLKEFLSAVTAVDNHLIWRIAKLDALAKNPNSCLTDLAAMYPNSLAANPEIINRLQFRPTFAELNLGDVALYYDEASGYNSLANLGDILRDVWLDGGAGGHEWDIVLDRARGITLGNPVKVDSIERCKRYTVSKSI
ncbi:MAG: hypothetical protein EPN88_16495 [Bacteroidetes bacterium]|nr:MAG: hypothetical protein EPN88_16495 [Bacteroidota bacterium]